MAKRIKSLTTEQEKRNVAKRKSRSLQTQVLAVQALPTARAQASQVLTKKDQKERIGRRKKRGTTNETKKEK